MEGPSPRNLPEHALRAFERLSGCDCSLHDLDALIWPFVDPQRQQHLRPPCSLVKRQRQEACTAFDMFELRRVLARQGEGVVKRCHAGIVELALPVWWEGRLWLVLFAGPRAPGPGLVVESAEPAGPPGAWSRAVAALPPLGGDEAAAILEAMRQLAARLVRWRADDLPRLTGSDGGGARRSRRDEILAWIQWRHRDEIALGDLAAHLGLSLERTGHAVVEACGEGFVALVTRERLRTAAELLRRSDLPVREVAGASGFRNRAHFHQVFRTRLGVSPSRWRRQREG